MAQGLVLCHASRLGISASGLIHFGLLFLSAEWKMSEERPWYYLTLLCTIHSQASTPSGSTSHLASLIAVFGFVGTFQVGSFMLSEGVRFTAYPLLTSSPTLHGLRLGMFAFRRQMLIFLLLQQARGPCGSYAKKGQPVLTNIYKSHLKDT